jgi:hypothetical protein
MVLVVSTFLSRQTFIAQVRGHRISSSITSQLTSSLGINFPAYAFENQAETEGFAKMAKRAGYQVIGLPNYIVWHYDTQEKGGNL